MALDESTEGLEKLSSNGVLAFIEPQLNEYLSKIGDIRIDYITNEIGSGYIVTVGEPNCGGCSCDAVQSSQ
jgi:Fe-S cluster assembly iron-binding protein IscA